MLLVIIIIGYGKNSDNDNKLSTKDIIESVGKLMVLPTEEPTIATVSDPESLKGQPFFMNAKIGDKVLIYSTAGKAIIYRPSINKVIEIAPFYFDKENLNAQQSN